MTYSKPSTLISCNHKFCNFVFLMLFNFILNLNKHVYLLKLTENSI